MIWDDVCDGAVTRRSGRNVINTQFALLFPGRVLSQSPRGSAAIHPVPLERTLLWNCPINQCPGDGGAPPADRPAGQVTCWAPVSHSAAAPIRDQIAKGPHVEGQSAGGSIRIYMTVGGALRAADVLWLFPAAIVSVTVPSSSDAPGEVFLPPLGNYKTIQNGICTLLTSHFKFTLPIVLTIMCLHPSDELNKNEKNTLFTSFSILLISTLCCQKGCWRFTEDFKTTSAHLKVYWWTIPHEKY